MRKAIARSSIEFDITFGVSGLLSVSWLRSYEGLGDALMTLNSRELRLPGLYGDSDTDAGNKVSQTYLHTFPAYRSLFQPMHGLSGLLGFEIKAGSTHVLRFETKPELASNVSSSGVSKFKLISVSTC